MFVTVAMPDALIVFVPGPWYSTIAPVPPLTVKMPATLRMMSGKVVSMSELYTWYQGVLTFRGGPARHLAGELDADELGSLEFPWKVCHHIHGVRTADADSTHAESTSVGRMGIGSDQEAAGEGIVFEDDLMDNATARSPESSVEFAVGPIR